MNEDLLAYIWSYKLYQPNTLRTIKNELVEVISAGQLNRHGGPDFHHAMIRIGGRLWAGHVELHVRSSDWNQHGHEKDGHYNNVILHVVFEHDSEIRNQRGQSLPTLELKPMISDELIRKYSDWQSSAQWIPCERHLKEGKIPQIVWSAVLDRMAIERLEDKARQIVEFMRSQNGDWFVAFLHVVCRSFGYKVNAEPMASLAARLPWNALLRSQNDRLRLEAIVFGMAGMLEGNPEDSYHAHLIGEYRFMQTKYGYKSLDPVIWQWGRVRPSNVPTIRLAQLCAAISDADRIREILLNTDTTAEAMFRFEFPPVSSYWNTHHRFGKTSAQNHGIPGKPAIQSLMINTIAPFWFAYGLDHSRQDYLDKAVELLQLCLPENNGILKKWRTLGVPVERAHDSQALLQLFHHYCSRKRCLKCGVGHKLLRES